jgi:hypothetical protein
MLGVRVCKRVHKIQATSIVFSSLLASARAAPPDAPEHFGHQFLLGSVPLPGGNAGDHGRAAPPERIFSRRSSPVRHSRTSRVPEIPPRRQDSAAPSRMFACPSAASISAKRRAVLPETGRENVTQDVGRDRAAHDGVDLVPRDGKMVRARDRAPPRRQAMAVSATDQPVAPQHCHCIAMIHSARSACASSATNRTAGPASRRHGLT